jgi:hypothetical protein
MGFSPTIKQQAMLASARHCCVCHRYKGIRIEVHHIEQEADGGPNTFENAIPLCFDCHSDAGHFNDRHPKGTKFSKQELIKSRNAWYEFIKNNPSIEKPIISDKIQASYYVLHSFDVLESVIANDFSSVNKYRCKVYLSSNKISSQWGNLLTAHKSDYKYNIEQKLIVEIRQFSTLDEYCQNYDNVEIIDKSGVDHPYYVAKREIKWTDLIDSVSPKNFINEISKSGIDAKHFCTSLLHENGASCCGETPAFGFTEYLEIAPISFIFLGITNTSKEPIKLNRLTTSNSDERFKLPNFNLLPYEMLLLPISTAINLRSIDNNGIVIDHLDGDRGQDFSRVLNANEFNGQSVKFFEKKIYPQTIIFNDNEAEYEIQIHEFDFHNLYSINSYWQCGSCPHLFFINNHGRQEYSRELLVSSSYTKGSDTFKVPEGVCQIIVRELEDEITYIDKLIVNEQVVAEYKAMRKGEKLVVNVKPFDNVTIEGSYEPFFKTQPKLNDMWYRNEIIKFSNANINDF